MHRNRFELNQVKVFIVWCADALNVRQTENLVRQWQQGVAEKATAAKPDPDIVRLQQIVGDKLGAEVAIKHGQKGKGKLVISYNSLDELDGILAHIK